MRPRQPPRPLDWRRARKARRRLGTFHQKLRRSLHRGSSHACSEAYSESTHLTILTMWGGVSEKARSGGSSGTGGLGCARHLSPLLRHAAEAILINPSAGKMYSRELVCFAPLIVSAHG